MLKIVKVAGLTTLLLALASIYGFAAVDTGNHKIPARVDFAGTVIEPGMYNIQVVDGQEGPYIQLSKGGQVVQKDLAIVIPAKGGNVSKPQVQIAKVAGQEFYRIRIRHADSWYYAYLKKAM
jgi:hypothetical protein